MTSFNDLCVQHNFICAKCTMPYNKPHILPSSGKIFCYKCWPKSVRKSSTTLWFHTPIADCMEQLKVQLEQSGENWQNEQTFQMVKTGDWKAVLNDLNAKPKRTWENVTKHILVEACEHANCPRDVIIALLESGINHFTPRPCINPCGIGAMNVCAVAAQTGCMEALYVFVERGIYWSFGCPLFPVSLAAEHGQADVLDYLWSIDDAKCHGGETIKQHSNWSITRYFAEKAGSLEKLEWVFEKHFPKQN